MTSQHRYRFASGIGGAIQGRSADLIIIIAIDDPIKALDALWEAERHRVWEFYSNTLSTRLVKRGKGPVQSLD